MRGEPLEVRGNIWLEAPGGVRLGRGRAQLLQSIDETGSIAEAARLLGMSYRRAWAMVKDLNAASEQPLVHKTQGGLKGGGARLSEEGKKLVAGYWKVFGLFQQFKQQALQEMGGL